MGGSSCTGPIRKEGLQAIMLDGELKLWGSLLTQVPLHYIWCATTLPLFS